MNAEQAVLLRRTNRPNAAADSIIGPRLAAQPRRTGCASTVDLVADLVADLPLRRRQAVAPPARNTGNSDRGRAGTRQEKAPNCAARHVPAWLAALLIIP